MDAWDPAVQSALPPPALVPAVVTVSTEANPGEDCKTLQASGEGKSTAFENGSHPDSGDPVNRKDRCNGPNFPALAKRLAAEMGLRQRSVLPQILPALQWVAVGIGPHSW
eukprot:CAMPEP_0174359434 /NCGR_PEP_ID=MMETSP0811_2-20130205/48638_1 /TAXON_ID=73025 ORGANISM="Eutreptiella gymnastica-like, Strain CCMP1594" /NCGR_SAMPLE_ID=MMETSP0811_2 /ASSEMBLY_ACC=CAM_ASM_000667 /LENGTH=109 /DNA_ID=CAMNT_0015494147 /DNA_START=748 /DNA_END=1075 /DNA_ORIENTATION=+